MKKKMKTGKIIAIAIPIILLAVFFGYFAIYSHNADETALQSSDTVKVSETADGYYLFDGEGTDDILIFYPGGKIEAEAYGALLKEIASRGVDCLLVEMPLNFPLFGITEAQNALTEFDYQNWYIGGHSLGGVCSCYFAEDNTAIFDGVVLLSSYSAADLSQTELEVISIYGDQDGVMDKEKYEEAKTKLPKDYTELIIEGGNHSNFGTYGKQSGDNDSTITAQEQRQQTAEAICQFIIQTEETTNENDPQ